MEVKVDLKITEREAKMHIKSQKSFYDKEYATYNKNQLENWRISYILRIFKMLNIVPGDIFLDIGVGGSGYTVMEASKINVRSIGIDISSGGMRTAHKFAAKVLERDKRSLCDFIICSATHLPFKKGSISKAAAVAILEHIPNDRQVITEISRAMKKKGQVFITVPNTYRRILPIFAIPYKIHDKKVGHLRHYKCEELIHEFDKREFFLKSVVYHAHFPKVIQLFLSTIFPWLQKAGSKLWWKFEELDSKLHGIPTGMHFSIHVEKL